MANRKLSKSFLNISADPNTTSEATGFPRDNAVDRTSPQRHWRSTATTDTRLVINLGTAQTNLSCYLDYVNFVSFTYQESTDGSTGWTDIGTTRTVEKDPMHGVYRRTDDITLTSKQYLGIWIPTQTPVDSASYFRVGTFAIPTSIVELDAKTDVSFPVGVSLPRTNIVDNVFPTGKRESVKLCSLQPMQINFDLLTSVEETNDISGTRVQEIADLLRDYTQTIYLDFNLSKSWQAYLVKYTGDVNASIRSPATGTVNFGTTLFEVIT